MWKSSCKHMIRFNKAPVDRNAGAQFEKSSLKIIIRTGLLLGAFSKSRNLRNRLTRMGNFKSGKPT